MWKVIADSIQLVVPTYRSARTAKVGTLTITRRRYLPHMSLSVFLSAPIHRSSSMSRFALGSSLGATKRHEEPRKADVNNLSPRWLVYSPVLVQDRVATRVARLRRGQCCRPRVRFHVMAMNRKHVAPRREQFGGIANSLTTVFVLGAKCGLALGAGDWASSCPRHLYTLYTTRHVPSYFGCGHSCYALWLYRKLDI